MWHCNEYGKTECYFPWNFRRQRLEHSFVRSQEVFHAKSIFYLIKMISTKQEGYSETNQSPSENNYILICILHRIWSLFTTLLQSYERDTFVLLTSSTATHVQRIIQVQCTSTQRYPNNFGILTTIWPNLALTEIDSRSSNSFTVVFWQISSISASPAWKTTLHIIKFARTGLLQEKWFIFFLPQ